MLLVRRQSERGFALLLVFLMAGAVALMLYRQMPRVAFETERDREQLLIDRGEQYKRGVQLFYLANKKLPSTLEELEKFQDKRYLRRRYKVPALHGMLAIRSKKVFEILFGKMHPRGKGGV